NTYNDLGHLLSTTDPAGNTTAFDYTDNYYNYIPSQPTLAFATMVTRPTTGGVSHIQRSQHYFDSGLIPASCRENFPSGSPCRYGLSALQSDYVSFTYDLWNRPVTTAYGDGGQTTLSYNERSLPLSISTVTKINPSTNLVNMTVYDGLGRTMETRKYENPTDYIRTVQTYDALRRPPMTANPSPPRTAAGWTIT